jgi:hypothetical protein
MRTCGTCGHWQPVNSFVDPPGGECDKAVPFWAYEETGAAARRFVRASDPGAADCECYVNALLQEDADG